MNSPINNILFITGEVSGDLHASYLVKALKKINPKLTFHAIGSQKLREAGVVTIDDLTKRSTIGFLEAFRHIPKFILLKNKIVKMLKARKFDLLICVDYQGFNMLIAAEAKKLGIPIVYYIPPQEWVWGSEKGMQKVVGTVDKVVAIFQEEYDCYKKYTDNVRYFGHPLIEIIKENLAQITKPIEVKEKLISVFPGSRKQEIKFTFPQMIKIMQELLALDPDYNFVVNLPNDYYEKEIRTGLWNVAPNIPIHYHKTYPVLLESKFALLTSGTICLEAAILLKPHVVLYKFGFLSYKIIKRVMKKFKFNNYSLTNIVAGKEVVKEYLQNFTSREVAQYIHQVITNNTLQEQVVADLERVKEKLQVKDNNNILDSVAHYILE